MGAGLIYHEYVHGKATPADQARVTRALHVAQARAVHSVVLAFIPTEAPGEDDSSIIIVGVTRASFSRARL